MNALHLVRRRHADQCQAVAQHLAGGHHQRQARHFGRHVVDQHALGIVVAVLFGLFPDIDTNSKGQDIFYGVAFLADILLIYDGRIMAAAFLGLLAMTPILSHHRGWTHSKPAMILVPSPIVLVPYFYNHRIFATAP